VGSIDLEDATSLEALQEKSGTSSARTEKVVHLIIGWPRLLVSRAAREYQILRSRASIRLSHGIGHPADAHRLDQAWSIAEPDGADNEIVGTKRVGRSETTTLGLAIYEGETAAAALAAYLRNKVRAANPGDYKIAQFGDGTASVLWRGVEYRNYRATSPG
jgi:hypothetical protein